MGGPAPPPSGPPVVLAPPPTAVLRDEATFGKRACCDPNVDGWNAASCEASAHPDLCERRFLPEILPSRRAPREKTSLATTPGSVAPCWRARVELRLGADDVRVLGEGQGRSLRDAEQAAATVALGDLEMSDGDPS